MTIKHHARSPLSGILPISIAPLRFLCNLVAPLHTICRKPRGQAWDRRLFLSALQWKKARGQLSHLIYFDIIGSIM